MPASYAVTDAYATVEDYRTHIQKSRVVDDSQIERDLTATSRFIDRYLNQHFTQDASDVARTFKTARSRGRYRSDWAESENPWLYGPKTRVLDVDNLVSVESIVVDQNNDNTFALTLEATDYELLPLNVAKGSEVKPYTQIGLTEYGTVVVWPTAVRVRVTGVWGWPSVPESIRVACLKFTAIMRNEGPEATGRVLELDQVVNESDEGRRMAYTLMRAYNDKVTM